MTSRISQGECPSGKNRTRRKHSQKFLLSVLISVISGKNCLLESRSLALIRGLEGF